MRRSVAVPRETTTVVVSSATSEQRSLPSAPAGEIPELDGSATEPDVCARIGLPSLEKLQAAASESGGRPALGYVTVGGFAGENTPSRFEEGGPQFRRARRWPERSRRHPIGRSPQRIDRGLGGVDIDDVDPIIPAQAMDGPAQQICPTLPTLDQRPSGLGERIGENQGRKTDATAEVDDRATELRLLFEGRESQAVAAMGVEITTDLSGAYAFEQQLLESGWRHLSRWGE